MLIWTAPELAESSDFIVTRPLSDAGEVDAPEVTNTPRCSPFSNIDPPLEETDLPADNAMLPALPADDPDVRAMEPESVVVDAVAPVRTEMSPLSPACRLMPLPLPDKLSPSTMLSRPLLCTLTDPPAELPIPATIEVDPPTPEIEAPAVISIVPDFMAAGPVIKFTEPDAPEAVAPLVILTEPPRELPELLLVTIEIDPEALEDSVRTRIAPDVSEVPPTRLAELSRTDPLPDPPVCVAEAEISTVPAFAAPLVLPADTIREPVLDALLSLDIPA
jgi:hypothetical protein